MLKKIVICIQENIQMGKWSAYVESAIVVGLLKGRNFDLKDICMNKENPNSLILWIKMSIDAG